MKHLITKWLRFTRLPPLFRLVRFAITRVLRGLRGDLQQTPLLKAKVVFDVRTERFFKRYLFTIVRCLSLHGVRSDFCLRLRFLVRDKESFDLSLLTKHPFRYVPPLFLRFYMPYAFLIQEGSKRAEHRTEEKHVRCIELGSEETSNQPNEYHIPLTLGPNYLF